ncbi:methylated-DNA--[protein]-cysteine S-methyltransferase [Streptomyces sp. NPDC058291]|jgi:methylated-DNA-[protein]-cysteine S-methyltransferase|uniref:methylated-DNA--[protein]-cysteine S-methyltransferase n=1 Tax=Streptomyces sp. NPDC058291 TaxID=3346427 RepID=UPI0036E12053
MTDLTQPPQPTRPTQPQHTEHTEHPTPTGRTAPGIQPDATTYWTSVQSPLGPLLLTADPDGALTSLSVTGQKRGRTVQADWRHDPGPFRAVREQLDAYFAADLKEFRLPLRSAGTAFREQVWAALDSVPYGATITYGEVAARVGASRMAVRAVGGAIGANPLLIVRACHRVIGADGSLTGYAGGLERKVRLLTLEGVLPSASV